MTESDQRPVARRRTVARLALMRLVGVTLVAVAACTPAAGFLDDTALRALLAEHTSAQGGPPGIAVALVTPAEVRFFCHGRADAQGTTIGPDTGFEIGSLTKTMTAFLAVEAAARGRLRLDDPLQRLLPPGAPRVARLDGDIRLVELLTHTSGLPRMPPNFRRWNLFSADPYVDYDETWLLESLARPLTERPLMREVSYSNYGFGLAGYAITREDGGYAAALNRRILEPLGMSRTHVAEPGAASTGMATGHDGQHRVAGYWRFLALAGAGGVRSTARDMSRYVQALLGASPPWADAFATMRKPRASVGKRSHIGLAWFTTAFGARSIVWHNGMTGGFATMVAIDPAASEAVVVLANAAVSMDDLGFQVLGALPVEARPR